jgi:ATP-dependent Clp protease ATP-binding subunit ClpA
MTEDHTMTEDPTMTEEENDRMTHESTATATPESTSTSGGLRDDFARVRSEVGKAVVGQDGAVTGLIIALLAGGHVLLEGVPGVAKTLLVRTLSRSLAARHQAHPVHPGPHAGRRDRLARLRVEDRRVRLPRRPGVHEHPAGG